MKRKVETAVEIRPGQTAGIRLALCSATIQTMQGPVIKLQIFLPHRNAGKCFNKNASVIENFHLKIITIFLFNSDTRILIETETFTRRNFSQIFKIMARLGTILNVCLKYIFRVIIVIILLWGQGSSSSSSNQHSLHYISLSTPISRNKIFEPYSQLLS